MPSKNIAGDGEELVPLLPAYTSPTTLLTSNCLPIIENSSTETLLKELQRQIWLENLFARKSDLKDIKRYQDANQHYRNDFDQAQFITWIKIIEKNTAICTLPNKMIGKGVFVPPGKKIPKGTFIPSSGIIELHPSHEALATKVHCSALQDLNSPNKTIYGLIDPEIIGGTLDLINHAPNIDELANFNFTDKHIKDLVATANLKSAIKFYQGYAIMGVEAIEDIDGGTHGKQLLWSYARPDEYIDNDLPLFLFDNRDECSGETLARCHYSWREIQVFIDTGKLSLQAVAALTRWELMESSPDDTLAIPQVSSVIRPAISLSALQKHLRKNPFADRIILCISDLRS